MKRNLVGVFSVKFPRYRFIRVLASLSIFVLLFGGLAGFARIANAAGFTLISPAQSETTVTLSWSQSSDVWFYSYTLWFSTTVNGPYSSIWSTGDKGVTSYAVSGLSSNTNYYFYIADAGLLENYDTNTLQVTTASNPQLTLTSQTYTTASLAWNDYNTYSSLEPFGSYTLQMSTSSSSGPWSILTTTTDSSQNTYIVTGLAPQTYWFILYDAVGPSGNTQSSYSNVVSVTIIQMPRIDITSSVTALDVGQQAQFSASASGGVLPYNYQWYSNGNPIAGATSSSFAFTPTTAGTYSILATLKDTSSNPPIDSNSITVTVNPPLAINISTSTSTLKADQQAQFSASINGGAPPYNYQWYSNGNPIAGATSSSFAFTPTTAGTYYISAAARDYYNATASSNSISETVSSSSSSSPLPLMSMIIAALIVIVIVIVAVALVLRSRSRNKTVKTK